MNVDTNSKAALQYLIEQAGHFEPLVTVGDQVLVRDRAGNVAVPPPEPLGDPLRVHSLSGLRDYVVANIDRLELERHVVHVATPGSVFLLGPRQGRHHRRQMLVEALADKPLFEYGKFYPAEEFRIALMSMFEDLERREIVEATDDRRDLLQAISRVSASSKVVQEDDGTSQTVHLESGAQLVAEKRLPNPVLLTPYRSFPEVPQVSSPFILRARGEGNVFLGLFEADGGAWRREARQRVARRLEELLDGIKGGTGAPTLPRLIV